MSKMKLTTACAKAYKVEEDLRTAHVRLAFQDLKARGVKTPELMNVYEAKGSVEPTDITRENLDEFIEYQDELVDSLTVYRKLVKARSILTDIGAYAVCFGVGCGIGKLIKAIRK